MLKPGDRMPDFEVVDQDGNIVKSSELTGKKTIIYFYPKDNTPGCTIEAEEFSTLLEKFEAKDTIIVGISPDSPKCHQNFIYCSHE